MKLDRSIVPFNVLELLRLIDKSGLEAYLVGGCVRDCLLGKEPKDWDVATNATPEQVKQVFPYVIPTGEKYGTVTVIMDKETSEIMPVQMIEVTTYRSDGNYSDGRRPDEVTYSQSIEEDLSRRDFRMNAIAWNPLSDDVVDPYDGIKDIENKRINCVGSAKERFSEDALRMLRLIRFSAQLGFSPRANDLLAVKDNAHLMKNVSQERIRDELIKILLSPQPGQAFGDMYITGLLDYIIPELSECAGFGQNNPHHNKDVFDHILAVIDASTCDLKVRLAALFHDIGKPRTYSEVDGIGHFYGHQIVGAEMTTEIMRRLRFPLELTTDINKLVFEHMSRVPKIRPKNIKRMINRVGDHNMLDLIELMKADIIGHAGEPDFTQTDLILSEYERILQEKPPMSLKDLAINGDDLIAIGWKPGKMMGAALTEAYEYMLDNPQYNTKEHLLAFLETVPRG